MDPELEQLLKSLRALDAKQVKELIERRHPEYAARLPHWMFCQATYEGGREWFAAGNIFKYHKEGASEYNDRVARAYRFPHTRETVDLVNKYIFKAKVQRQEQGASEEVKKFWKAATHNRRGIDDFARLMSERSSVLGRLWIVVDNNNTTGDATLLDEKESGARVYAYTVSPQDVLDLGANKDGETTWVKLLETHRDDASIFSSGNVTRRFRFWDQNCWHLWEEGYDEKKKEPIYTLIDFGYHGLGRLPVFPLDHILSDNPYHAMSLIDDIAYLDRAVANYLSNLDAIIQDQTFSQLVMPAQSLLPDDDMQTKVLELGTKRIFTYDATGQGKPEYISPDPKQASMILAVINKIINEIYHSVGMAGERTKQDNAMGIDNSSGVAKAFDFERLNAMLTSKARSLEVAENTLCELVDAWNGVQVEPGSCELVKYPESFDVRGLTEELQLGMQLSLLGAPDKVRQEQMYLLVDKMFPHLSKDTIAALKAEIKKSWPPEEPAAGDTTKPPSAFQEKRQGQNNKGKDD